MWITLLEICATIIKISIIFVKQKKNKMISCSRCQQELQYPVYVNGLAYGQDCASKILGLTKMPNWFNDKSNEDYYVQKQKNDDTQAQNLIRYNNEVEITKECWNEFYLLSKIFVNFRSKNNDWGMNFISSISNQLGLGCCLQTEETLFETYEIAITNWKDYMGSFPYKTRKPKSIYELSEKQQQLINKYL